MPLASSSRRDAASASHAVEVVTAFGVPFPSTDIRVVEPDDPTRDRGIDEEGELLIRGPQVFQGYWNRPDDTRETLLPGGGSGRATSCGSTPQGS